MVKKLKILQSLLNDKGIGSQKRETRFKIPDASNLKSGTGSIIFLFIQIPFWYNNNEHRSLCKYMAFVNVDIRQSILETTRKMLVEYGYYAVSMRKIASKAGCGLGTIYLYFENKDVLFHTLIDEGFEKMYHLISEAVGDLSRPLAALQSACRAYISFGLENPEYYEIMYLLHPDRLERYPREKYRRARRSFELIAGIMERIADEKGIILSNSKLLSYSLWASLHGATSILIARRLDISIDKDEFIDSVIQSAINGLNLV